MMIEFDYKREHLRTGEIVFRPVAKIYIREIEGEWIAEYFYVDSGADFTLIPYQMDRLNSGTTKIELEYYIKYLITVTFTS